MGTPGSGMLRGRGVDFSEGARRTLGLAKVAAQSAGSSKVAAVHLLWALLVADDPGVRNALRRARDSNDSLPREASALASSSASVAPASISYDLELLQVLEQSAKSALSSGASSITEVQLFSALLVAAPGVAQVLADYGYSVASLRQWLTDHPPADSTSG